MTGHIIRSGEALDIVRGVLEPAARAAITLQDPELARMTERMNAIQAELKQSRASIERLKAVAASSYAKGEEAGYEAGLQAADDRAQERCELLRANANKALSQYADRMADVESLAILIARECLDTIFGNHLDRAEKLHAIIRHQIDQIDAQNILRISVSPGDFSELEQSLGGLVSGSRSALAVDPDDGLKPGEITIALSLGHVSAGVDQQWGRIRPVLTDLAEAAE